MELVECCGVELVVNVTNLPLRHSAFCDAKFSLFAFIYYSQ
jgi:hypothetical protein